MELEFLLVIGNGARLHADGFVIKPTLKWFVGTYDIHAASCGNGIFHLQTPIDCIGDQSAKSFVLQVDAAPHRAMEYSRFATCTGTPRLGPSDRKGGEFRVGQIVRFASHQRLAPYQCRALVRQTRPFFIGSINIGVPQISSTPVRMGCCKCSLSKNPRVESACHRPW